MPPSKKNTFTKFNKLHIKYMFVAKRSGKKKNVVDIGIVLDNNQYVEYTLAFKQQYLTVYVAARIKDVFARYVIDNRTDVIANDALDEQHPVYMYLDMLRPHIQFKFMTTSQKNAMRRLAYYFKCKNYKSASLNAVWKTALVRGACPWIDSNVDHVLQNMTDAKARRMKNIRLSLLYIAVKSYLYNVVQKSVHKNA